MTDAVLRPMTDADVPLAERLSAEAFHELDLRTSSRARPDPVLRPPERGSRWVERTRHLLRTDPGGCWVAEREDGLLGVVTSFTRELMWCLATYAVRPGLQGQGLGRALLAAALDHGRGCLRGMVTASADPRAVRRYRLAGFSLHPQMLLAGTVDRAAIPVGSDLAKVRGGVAGDVDLMDGVDRATRGAAHGADHELLLRHWRLSVTDSSTGQGYAYSDGAGGVQLLAATNRRTAVRLLWEVLATSTGRVEVRHVTAANEWALDVGLAGRLEVHTSGYLGLRGMRPPAPYLHNSALL